MRTRRLLTLPLLAVCLYAATGSPSWADDQKADDKKTEEKKTDKMSAMPDAKALDGAIYGGLGKVINKGADIYNLERDYHGCARLYEGALIGYRPLLAHRANLQKAIDDALAQARVTPNPADRAFVLRAALDQIRKETNPNPTPTPTTKTLWDRLGGKAGVSKVVKDLVKIAAKDDRVDLTRGGKYKLDDKGVADLEQHLVDYISSKTGGPLSYSGKSMKEVHKGMGITDEQFNASVEDLRKALKDNDVAPDAAKEFLDFVETTRKDIVEPKPEPEAKATLWERLGGEPKVKKIVTDFYDAVIADPKVDFSRGGKHDLSKDKAAREKVEKETIDYISAKTKGPFQYKGPDMKEVHKGMGVTDEQFNAAAEDLKKVLEKNEVKPEAIKEVMDAVEKMRPDIVQKK